MCYFSLWEAKKKKKRRFIVEMLTDNSIHKKKEYCKSSDIS